MDKLIPWPERIRQLNSEGWSMQALATAIGLSKGALTDIASGRSTEPRGYAAVRLYQLAGKRPPNGAVSLRALR